MEVKAFAATLGIGVLAGAAAALLIPKQSKAYQVADDAAKKLKQEVSHAMCAMKK